MVGTPIEYIQVGRRCIGYVSDLWKVTRSVCGPGLRYSIEYFANQNNNISIIEIATGTELSGGWKVPEEWELTSAYIEHENGFRYIDACTTNLHVVNYSIAIDRDMDWEELSEHLHYIKEDPEAIPYITSYYKKKWGFCMTYRQFVELPRSGKYRVCINSSHRDGSLSLGHAVVKGERSEEIFFSSYLCHPSMANNELSGPSLLFELLEFVSKLKNPKLTYRFLLGPETLGAIAYLSEYSESMKRDIIAGFGLSCVGDNNSYSYVKTPDEVSLADKAMAAAMLDKANVKAYPYTERGSEERQFASALAGLPYVAFSRTRAGEYPEYHTNKDDMSILSAEGFSGSFAVLATIITSFEMGCFPVSTSLGEPHLSTYDLYSTEGHKGIWSERLKSRMNILAYSNGSRSIFDICLKCNIPLALANEECKLLEAKGLLSLCFVAS